MKAYHGEKSIKEKYLARVRAHRAADELIKGQYWQDGKGCAVGCTIHGSQHERYETELGIPRMVARLEDGLFERLTNELAMTWPERFLEAIAPGADLGLVGWRFLHWLLVDPVEGVVKVARTERSEKAIRAVGDLLARKLAGEEVPKDEWKAAAAYAAAADTAAADTAAYAAADDTAAYAAADAYAAAADTAAAYAAAREKATIQQSERLLELLREAPVSAN